MSAEDKTDWYRCVVCKKAKPFQKLQCPADTKRDAGAGYYTLAANILKNFTTLDAFPLIQIFPDQTRETVLRELSKRTMQNGIKVATHFSIRRS